MHIDNLIAKLEEQMSKTNSHQKKTDLIWKIEELKEKRSKMESWEVKDVDPKKYL